MHRAIQECVSPVHVHAHTHTHTHTPSTADGTTIVWRLDNLFAPISKLTGPDIEHVTSTCHRGDKIYTSCRDGCVRVYATENLSLSV